MRLKTIWTMRAMSPKERLSRTGEWVLVETAVHMPKRLAYWVVIVHGSRYFEPNEVVPDVRFMDIVQRFGDKDYDKTVP